MAKDKYKKKASKARERRNCKNKKAYKTEAHAVKGSLGFSKFKLKPYKCPICGQFHLTKRRYRWSLE